MGKFDGILIVTDIDGTFLGNKSRKVPENFEAIEYFKANGGVFTFASGRLHYSIDRVIPNPEKVANAPFILANGSCLYDFSLRKSVLTDCLNGHEAIPIFKYVREKYKTVGIRISSEIGFVVDELNDIIKRDLANIDPGEIRVIPVDEWGSIESDWFKVVLRDSAERLDAIREDLESKFPDAFECCKSAPTFYELQRKGCTKASAISKLKGLLKEQTGLDYTVYACGDFENDIAMLKAADVAVCPENALDTVKAVCDHTLCHCDKGLIADLVRLLDSKI